MTRLEFAGPAWVDQLEQALRQLAAAADGPLAPAGYSMSETYMEPPEHLRPTVGTLGWHMRVDGDAVRVERTPALGCDCDVIADYAAVLPLARLSYEEPAGREAGAALRAEMLAAGTLRITLRDGVERPSFLAPLHELMVRVTA